MKKLLFLGLFLLVCISGFSQNIPQGIPFQGVARDLGGHPIADMEMDIRINLLSNGAEGILLYEEYHKIKTNKLGLFNLVIGQGRAANDASFSSVPWANENVWLELSIRKTGSNDNWSILSNSQLLSVPYAMHSGSAGKITTNDQTSFTGPFWKTTGNNASLPQFHFIGNVDAKDLNFRTANQNRLTIQSSGDIEIDKSLEIGENLDVGLDANIGRDLNVGRNTDIDNNLNVDGNTDLNGYLKVNNGSPTDLSGTLNVDGRTDLNNVLEVDGATDLNSSLTVDGSTDLNTNLNVDGSATFNGTANLNGQVVIDATLSGSQGSLSAYPLIIRGSNQGVAIKVNAGLPSNNNNFITFFDSNNNARGTIEGETEFDLNSNDEHLFEEGILLADVATKAANIGFSALPNACGGVGAVACPPEPSVVAIAIAEEVLALANLASYDFFRYSQLGVTYQSGSADYAEWLMRLDPSERISAGDIVGIYGGKVSKSTSNANQYLVVSTNPAILGNMPEEGKEALYEKIAFMGQIPVKVRGAVNIGDYILPSELNDGTGIAVSPKNIQADQYSKIIGIAWSANPKENRIGIVNLSIGLNSNDVAKLVQQQNEKIQELEQGFLALAKRIEKLENNESPTEPPIAEPLVFAEPQENVIADYNGVPMDLDVEAVNNAILSLKTLYMSKVPNQKSGMIMNKLFTDENYRLDIIRKIQETYKEAVRNKR